MVKNILKHTKPLIIERIAKKKNKKLKSAVLATSEPKLSEAGEFLGEFFNVHSFKMHPTTMRFVESEAQRLKEWSQLDTSLRLADFVDGQGYSPEIFISGVENLLSSGMYINML